MKRQPSVSSFNRIILALISIAFVPIAANAYHFDIVATSGVLWAYDNVPFEPGPCSVQGTYHDEWGECAASASASSNFQVSGRSCLFSASTSATGHKLVEWHMGCYGTGAVYAEFTLRVVADPGDTEPAGLYIDWYSTTQGPSCLYNACCAHSHVDAWLSVNNTNVAYAHASNQGDGTDPADATNGIICQVQDGDIIQYGGGYDDPSVKTDAGGWLAVFPCNSSGSSQTSMELLLIEEGEQSPQNLSIACEGTVCGGGGTATYQYSLRNESQSSQSLTLFYLGTMDLDPTNYTNWIIPSGFTATVAGWDNLFSQFGTSIMATTSLKTEHGAIPPQQGYQTPGGIVWSGSAVIPSGQQLTFGFDNPHYAIDVEWFAEHPDAANSSQGYLSQSIAGPLGIFTNGYIHGPGLEEISVEESTWGSIKAFYK